jgi:RimJ/RimL family protein N-acetyltransferase
LSLPTDQRDPADVPLPRADRAATVTSLLALPIRTARLSLEPLAFHHIDELSRVLSDPQLHQFIGPTNQPDLRLTLERQLRGSPSEAVSWCNWAVRLAMEDCLVGAVQATVFCHRDRLSAEVAWVLAVAWQRRGLAQEAARALVSWLAEFDVQTVVAYIHPQHAASQAVARAMGLVPTKDWRAGEVAWHAGLGRSRP